MSRNIELFSGSQMPLVGLGTWHHGSQQEMSDAVRCFLKLQPPFSDLEILKMFANCGYILRYSGLLSKKGFGTLTVPTAMEMRKRWER